MCGILACMGLEEPPLKACELLHRRGPDFQRTLGIGDWLTVQAHVLHMQGSVEQPVVRAGDVLCFNGELYDGEGGSDSLRLMDMLMACESHEERCRVIDGIEGEWSLFFYSKATDSILFGRDRFGRRSLLEARDATSGSLKFISSTAWSVLNWTEVPVATMFSLRSDGSISLIQRPDRIIPCFSPSERLLPTWKRVLVALEDAVRRRIDPNTLGESKQFAILFSGGIDSVLIAVLAHRVCLDPSLPIPLVNVSFQDERSPDRIASREALKELQQLCPNRNWQFIAVNPTVADVADDENSIIAHISPKSTVMDFNIGAVLWFASKASPVSCRALLTGLGADELCGGYGRHRTASVKGGKEALKAELQLDLGRMWTRNLGRDDRCVAAFGKELRVPFLDQAVIDVIFDSPLEDLVDFNANSPTAPDGRRGDKLVLRKLMHELGLPVSAEREKRAAQFGSRMAKLVKSGRSGKDAFHMHGLTATATAEVLWIR